MATFRYAPSSLMTIVSSNPLHGRIVPVVKHVFIPASARIAGDYCIISTMGVLVMTTDTGIERVYGMDQGAINSELRMIVSRNEWTDDPTSCRDEVIRNQWPIVKDEVSNDYL